MKEARPSRLPVMLKGQFASFLRTDFELVLKIASDYLCWAEGGAQKMLQRQELSDYNSHR